MNITVIGTVFVDIKGFPQGKFIPDGRNAGDVKQFHGGVGRNIAEDVAALGARTTFVSLVDESGIGADVIAHLNAKGIVTDYVRKTKDGLGTWLAIFDEHGEVCANLSKRPDLLPIVDILGEKGDEIFSSSDSILLEIDIDEEIVKKTFELAEKHAVPVYTVISNMTIAKERLPYIGRSACFVCNRAEAGILFNEPTEKLTHDEMIELMKRKQAQLGLNSVIVTMDADGAAYLGENGECGFCEAKKVEVVDTTGAGDSFFAGCSFALTKKESLAEACALGRDTAAAVITTHENVYSG